MPKVITLNMWGYHEWDRRKDNIVALINREQPDCIALQEVMTNHAFSDFPSSDFVADRCGYKYRSFTPTLARNNSRDREGCRTQRASLGQAFLSKYPIISSEAYFLKFYPVYPEESSVQFCQIELEGTTADFCNVHFANRSAISGLHLCELMSLIGKRNAQPIILGDFNIWNLSAYKGSGLNGYLLSTDAHDYISMPGDNGTLDYIAAPLQKYAMQDVICPGDYVSDHRAVLATIALLQTAPRRHHSGSMR